MNIGQSETLFCRRCAKVTEHVALYVDQREESQGDGTGLWDLDHHVSRGFMECIHCSHPKIRLNVLTYPADGETSLSIPSEPARHAPTWISVLPDEIREVLLEVHEAFSVRHYWLMSSGVRTLLELFAVERIGRVGNFDSKLIRLHAEGYLSATELLLMQQIADFGSGAAERSQRPTERECTTLLDIAEHLLQKLTFGAHAETLGRVLALDAKAAKQ